MAFIFVHTESTIVELPCIIMTFVPINHRSEAPSPYDRVDSNGPDAREA
jgi:hypothetical protein